MSGPSAVLVPSILVIAAPAAAASSLPSQMASSGAPCADGAKGALGNIGDSLVGNVHRPIFYQKTLGRPLLDGNVVRADSTVTFKSWGSCMAQVAFKMQTKACGAWGCHWETRNNGKWEYLWKHAHEGAVSQQVTMGCRKGEHSYRVVMDVVGPAPARSLGRITRRAGSGAAPSASTPLLARLRTPKGKQSRSNVNDLVSVWTAEVLLLTRRAANGSGASDRRAESNNRVSACATAVASSLSREVTLSIFAERGVGVARFPRLGT